MKEPFTRFAAESSRPFWPPSSSLDRRGACVARRGARHRGLSWWLYDHCMWNFRCTTGPTALNLCIKGSTPTSDVSTEQPNVPDLWNWCEGTPTCRPFLVVATQRNTCTTRLHTHFLQKKEKKTRYVVKFNVNKAIFEPNNLICNENNSFLRTQSSLSQSQKDANKDKQYYLQRNTKNSRSYVSELQIFLANTAGRYKHLNNIVIQ